MHLSNKHRVMNQTFTIITNQHYQNADDLVVNSTETSNDRFRTYTKTKNKQSEESTATVIVNQYPKRYFDSPTMIEFNDSIDNDDDDEEKEIPIVRCANKSSILSGPEPSLDETDLTDLYTFTNPNRALSESMQVVISRHPSLEEMRYINDISSVLVMPPLCEKEIEEHIYQELIRINHSTQEISIDRTKHMDIDLDENKENRPPLQPIKCATSRIPVWTPPSSSLNQIKPMQTHMMTQQKKKTMFNGTTPKMTPKSKPNLTNILDDWNHLSPKLKELLSHTRKMSLRMPDLTPHSVEFRRLKNLLHDLEMITSSWTNAINQCRYVLQQAQQQNSR